jgi:hypothetical protein
VIRASGARCDITRLALSFGAGACTPVQGGLGVQKATFLEESPDATARAERLRHLVLVRIACALRGATKSEIAGDLAPLMGAPLVQWRAEVEREINALAARGLVTVKSGRHKVTDAGEAHAGRYLGEKRNFSRVWSNLRDMRLVAVALGMENEPAKHLKALTTLDGLRGAIVAHAFKLDIKGVVTPARLREALAAAALKRAFRDRGKADLAGKLGLSPKAGRLLAGQLAREPRDFGTDTRLIAALAAEHAGAPANDLSGLRMAVLRRHFGHAKAAPVKRRPSKRALGKGVAARTEHVPQPAAPPAIADAALPVSTPALVRPAPTGRPDLAGFASEVRRHAASHAQGWSGDRKAYISHVWRNVQQMRPEWGLSEIEFKCMLTEAHRTGQLVLANADLKDKDNIRDVQDSAVSYRNTVFHFIRVDA